MTSLSCEAWTGRTHEVFWRCNFCLRLRHYAFSPDFWLYLVYHRRRFGIDEGEMLETYGLAIGWDASVNRTGIFWHWKYDTRSIWSVNQWQISQVGGFWKAMWLKLRYRRLAVMSNGKLATVKPRAVAGWFAVTPLDGDRRHPYNLRDDEFRWW